MIRTRGCKKMQEYTVLINLENEKRYSLNVKGTNEDHVFSQLFAKNTGSIKIKPFDNDVVVYINFDKVLEIQIQPLVE